MWSFLPNLGRNSFRLPFFFCERRIFRDLLRPLHNGQLSPMQILANLPHPCIKIRELDDISGDALLAEDPEGFDSMAPSDQGKSIVLGDDGDRILQPNVLDGPREASNSVRVVRAMPVWDIDLVETQRRVSVWSGSVRSLNLVPGYWTRAEVGTSGVGTSTVGRAVPACSALKGALHWIEAPR